MKGILKARAQIWPHTRIQRCLVHVQRDTRADLTGRPRLQAGRELTRLADMLTRVHEPDAADTRIQRCLVHVQRDTRADLTGRPRLQAGRELTRLADMLTRVHEPDAAVRWGGAPDAWHGRWRRMLAERTYAKDNPDDPRRLADMLTRVHEPDAAVRWGGAPDAWHGRWRRMLAERTYAKDNPDDPRAATSRGGWWWTHLPLRRAYFRLERLFKDGTVDPFAVAPRLFQTRTPLQRRHTLLFPRPRAHDSRPGAA